MLIEIININGNHNRQNTNHHEILIIPINFNITKIQVVSKITPLPISVFIF